MSEKRFGAFEGVFTPTILSILGVIMYLRLGWVVGNVGLLMAVVIICLSNVITIATGLSISSIVTNINVGAGGAYSVISKSFGLSLGGAVGIPLYIAQAVSVAFYITGFAECWAWVFPAHNMLFVSLTLWIILLVVTYVSARIAFRMQYAIMAIIVLSLVSIFLGKPVAAAVVSVHTEPVARLGFWVVFAVFFPAVTGILAGTSMSGELEKPERAIPIGTLSAIFLSFLIYIAVAYWFSAVGTQQELIANTNIVVEKSRWQIIVVLGIMGATLSSALSMFVASPRTLLALGKNRTVPFWRGFAHVNKRGEPSISIIVTALIAAGTLFLGTLDTIATFLTMIFLVTYGLINVAVLVEQSIGIVSFRPSLRFPVLTPFVGFVGCLLVMFLINWKASVIACAVIAAIYMILIQKESGRYWPDIRKGFFIHVAEQSLKAADRFPYYPKIWKPNVLIPVKKVRLWPGLMNLINGLCLPSGRVTFFTIVEKKSNGQMLNGTESKMRSNGPVVGDVEDDLKSVSVSLQEKGLLVSHAVVESPRFIDGFQAVVQSLRGSFFPPNVLFVKAGSTSSSDAELEEIFKRVKQMNMGIIIFKSHPEKGFGEQRVINVWIRTLSGNVGLSILAALQLERNWDGVLRLSHAICEEKSRSSVYEYLSRLKESFRLPKDTEIQILVGSFEEAFKHVAPADVNIFGLSDDIRLAFVRSISEKIDTAAIFVKDSKQESINA
ncbi:MAG: amino acid permease [bacterium]